MAVMIVGYFSYESLSSSLDARSCGVSDAESQLESKAKKLSQAKRAVKRLKEYQAKSLPSDGELARSLYQNWLLERLEKAGFRDVKLGVLGARSRVDAFQLHTFNVGCRGNLKQLTVFLHELYSVDRLQRVRRLSLKPIPDTKDLDVGFTVEALIAEGRRSEGPSERRTFASIGVGIAGRL
jgi:hypothetical protein